MILMTLLACATTPMERDVEYAEIPATERTPAASVEIITRVDVGPECYDAIVDNLAVISVADLVDTDIVLETPGLEFMINEDWQHLGYNPIEVHVNIDDYWFDYDHMIDQHDVVFAFYDIDSILQYCQFH